MECPQRFSHIEVKVFCSVRADEGSMGFHKVKPLLITCRQTGLVEQFAQYTANNAR